MRRIYLAVLLAGGALVAALPVSAQQNLGHFYMARQQIQILDDTPAVNDMRTQPAPPGQQQQQGALMNRPQPLPKAGWQGYASTVPSMSSSLPKTFNGVPQKAPPPVNPRNGKAGTWKAPTKAAKPAAPSGPPSAKAYAPYQGYGGPQGASRPPVAAAGNGMSNSTAVRGSLLHWSRTGH